jgi:hypothetical protein
MTSTHRSTVRFADIADLFDQAGEQASDRFELAFTETIEGFRMSRADDETDAEMPDPLAMERATELLVTTMFDALRDTRLEPFAERLGWGIVHAFHKVAEQVAGEADRAAQQVRALIRDADGSEVATGELEAAQTLCRSLDEAEDALACLRDHAGEIFRIETGRPWAPPRGTLVSSKRTASVISAQDYLAARAAAKREARAPSGPVVVFSGGQEWEDHRQLWALLDDIKARIPAMILATTAQAKGCDAIAAAWAASAQVKLVAFGLDRRLGNRAGFVRNERMIGLGPVEAVVCEGSGLQAHLAREVLAAGIPATLVRKDGQAPRAA